MSSEGHDAGEAHSGHSHGVSRATQRRALWIALVANSVFLVSGVAGGLAFRSLALLADAAHMLSDVAGLVIALVAQRLLDRPPTPRHSYGMQRAEVLGAQANGVTLLAVSGWIVFEAVRRIGQPAHVSGGVPCASPEGAGRAFTLILSSMARLRRYGPTRQRRVAEVGDV